MRILTSVLAVGVALLVGSAPPPARAAASGECASKAHSQVEIGNCVSETLETVDQVMAMALGFAQQTATQMDADNDAGTSSLDALNASQAAWEAFRDKQCAFVAATFGGGSGASIGANDCRVEMGRARTAELMHYVR